MNEGEASVSRFGDSVSVPRVVLGALVALAVADIALTLVGRQSCFVEQNPFARWILHGFGPAGLVALKGAALGILGAVILYLPTRYERAAVGGFGLTQLFAVGWNSLLLLSQPAICGV